MEYAIVIEQTPLNFSAYVPDLPGCVATGATWDKTVREMHTAIVLHIESLREQSERIPVPRSTTTTVELVVSR